MLPQSEAKEVRVRPSTPKSFEAIRSSGVVITGGRDSPALSTLSGSRSSLKPPSRSQGDRSSNHRGASNNSSNKRGGGTPKKRRNEVAEKTFQAQIIDLAAQCNTPKKGRSGQREAFAKYQPDLTAFLRPLTPTSGGRDKHSQPSKKSPRSDKKPLRTISPVPPFDPIKCREESSVDRENLSSDPQSTSGEEYRPFQQCKRRSSALKSKGDDCNALIFEVYEDLCNDDTNRDSGDSVESKQKSPDEASGRYYGENQSSTRYYADGQRKGKRAVSPSYFSQRSAQRSVEVSLAGEKYLYLDPNQQSMVYSENTTNVRYNPQEDSNAESPSDSSFDIFPSSTKQQLQNELDQLSATRAESPAARSQASLSEMRVMENSILDQSAQSSSNESKTKKDPEAVSNNNKSKKKEKKQRREEKHDGKEFLEAKLRAMEKRLFSELKEKEDLRLQLIEVKESANRTPQLSNKREARSSVIDDVENTDGQNPQTPTREKALKSFFETQLVASLIEEITELKKQQASPGSRSTTPTATRHSTPPATRPLTPSGRPVTPTSPSTGSSESPASNRNSPGRNSMVPRRDLIRAKAKLELRESELRKLRSQIEITPTNAKMLSKVIVELKIARKTEENLAMQLAQAKNELEKVKKEYANKGQGDTRSGRDSPEVRARITQLENEKSMLREQINEETMGRRTEGYNLKLEVKRLRDQLAESAHKARSEFEAREKDRRIWESKIASSQNTAIEFQRSLKMLQEKLGKAEAGNRDISPALSRGSPSADRVNQDEISLLKFKLQNAEAQMKEERQIALDIDRRRINTIKSLQAQLGSRGGHDRTVQSLQMQLDLAQRDIATMKRRKFVMNERGGDSPLARAPLSPIAPKFLIRRPATPDRSKSADRATMSKNYNDIMSPPFTPPRIGDISSPPSSEGRVNAVQMTGRPTNTSSREFSGTSKDFIKSSEELLQHYRQIYPDPPKTRTARAKPRPDYSKTNSQKSFSKGRDPAMNNSREGNRFFS